MYVTWMLRLLVSKALQDFDLALRGKKKREKFLKDGKRKELTVSGGGVGGWVVEGVEAAWWRS